MQILPGIAVEGESILYKLINQWEPIVYELLQEYMKSGEMECCCERCQVDIMALVLNNMPPRYTVTRRGEIFTSVESCSAAKKAEILIEIMNTAKIVAASPSHNIYMPDEVIIKPQL